MRHTSGSALLIGALIGGVLGWAGQWLLVISGNPALVPPVTWGAALGALGAVLLALAWPIRAHVRGVNKKPPVDPFYATRVVLLAKAGSLAGLALGGLGIGFLIFFASRPVVSSDAVWPSIVAVVGAVVLSMSALIVERWCTLPPDAHESGGDAAPEGEIS